MINNELFFLKLWTNRHEYLRDKKDATRPSACPPKVYTTRGRRRRASCDNLYFVK